MKIIALGHRKRKGKDTFAGFLAQMLKINTRGKFIKVCGFSDKLKEACNVLYGWTGLKPGQFYDTKEGDPLKDAVLPLLGMTPRRKWIDFAEHLKLQDPNVFLNALLKQDCDYCIIKDLRFPHEAQAVHENGGVCYKIENSRVPNIDDEADTPLENYSLWNGIIHNEGTLEDLRKQAYNLGEFLLKGQK